MKREIFFHIVTSKIVSRQGDRYMLKEIDKIHLISQIQSEFCYRTTYFNLVATDIPFRIVLLSK